MLISQFIFKYKITNSGLTMRPLNSIKLWFSCSNCNRNINGWFAMKSSVITTRALRNLNSASEIK